MTTTLGLIAGNGHLPLIVAQGMHKSGARVIGIGLKGHFSPRIPGACDAFYQAGMLQPGKWIRLLKRAGVTEAVMVGGVSKATMHDASRLQTFLHNIPDWRAINLWYRHLRHDRRNATVLRTLADDLARSGVTLIDSTTYITDHLATPGSMGAVSPSEQQQRDIDFGWPMLKQVVELEIGQSIAVREGDVIAVEAVEGTRGLIKRAGELCRRKGWTLLKTSSIDHDNRADVPSIGVETIEQVAQAGGSCIAVGAGRVICVDKQSVIAAADKAQVALVGIE